MKNNKLIKRIFKLIWSHWIQDREVIKITGWRSAILETDFYGHKSRQRIWFCFTLFGYEFD